MELLSFTLKLLTFDKKILYSIHGRLQRKVVYILVKNESKPLTRCPLGNGDLIKWSIWFKVKCNLQIKKQFLVMLHNRKIMSLNKFNWKGDSLVKVPASIWTLRNWEYPILAHKFWSSNSAWLSKNGLVNLTRFRPVLILRRSQSNDLHSKSMDWFLHNYDIGLKQLH